ncbi:MULTISPECIES: hypothetical protein [unclassified Curtobacterium]|uniref:hypothetical protein n=1 Tax=unclassified Curtobacterium TaxID=257496 RepID=UPI003805CFAE
MAAEELTYPARIETPGRTYETTFATITGRRTAQTHWTPDGELTLFDIELVSDLEADVVVYRATAVFDLRPESR